MKAQISLLRVGALALCLLLAVACAASETPTSNIAPTQSEVTSFSAVPTATPLPFPSPSATLLVPSPAVTPSPVPAQAATPASASWYGTDAVALFFLGDYESGDLYALDQADDTRIVLADVGEHNRVSPDGRWLGFFRRNSDGQVALELHDIESGERRVISGASGDAFPFAFDASGRRLAYLDLGAYSPDGMPWALVVAALDQGVKAGVRYEAQMTGYEARPLPGYPLGWSQVDPEKDELLFDTFAPFTEGGYMGVWGVMLPADGASASLDSLPLREWVPGAPVYFAEPKLAPDGQSVAFLGRDLSYKPQGYTPEFYDLAVNRLEVAVLSVADGGVGNGTRTAWIALDDGSALGRALAWSPDGERLLFAQGRYEGETWAALTLKSTGRSGDVREYGALNRIGLDLSASGDLLELAWCDASLALYVSWDGQAGTRRLFSFDLEDGLETEIGAAQRIEIVGCAP